MIYISLADAVSLDAFKAKVAEKWQIEVNDIISMKFFDDDGDVPDLDQDSYPVLLDAKNPAVQVQLRTTSGAPTLQLPAASLSAP